MAKTATQGPELEASSTVLPTQPAARTAAQVLRNPSMDYCFAYPEGFAHSGKADHTVVVGTGPDPGLLWVDVADAGGRTAQDVADSEAAADPGLNPPRSTLMLGGKEALRLDGLPGQDAVRRVYIVHDGSLYTLTFSPYQSGRAAADAQMETLYAAVTPSWVWISSGAPCPAGA
ncbi:MAG TPA: hypothetical protein VLD63_03865 [Anaerolineales bacterium]|nr:hypothetical protein [Anaerolineales bacterium]